ncbi:MAG: 1-acyl-sn-glycerol-3-phosphate acyltransferase [Treponema sp.]|nr:1-acyl-sn-glycerol-3-phosphate acyltransferase [Treponema sp.]
MRPITPQLGIHYPDDPFEHIIPVKKIRELNIDSQYPFLDKSFGFRFMRRLMYLGICVIVFPLTVFRFGLKIEGRKNLRKHRKLLRNGAMTVSNHIHRWDFLFILRAIRFRMMYFPAWKENLLGSDMDLIRLAGGIPVPEDIHTIKYFNMAFDEIHAKKIWFHVFPEGANWYYYRPIRPFKKGVFSMAYRYKLPVLPIAFYYAKPGFPLAVINLFRKVKLPAIAARIGEPILPDTELPRKESVRLLREQCHRAIIDLAGVENNPWPAEGD